MASGEILMNQQIERDKCDVEPLHKPSIISSTYLDTEQDLTQNAKINHHLGLVTTTSNDEDDFNTNLFKDCIDENAYFSGDKKGSETLLDTSNHEIMESLDQNATLSLSIHDPNVTQSEEPLLPSTTGENEVRSPTDGGGGDIRCDKGKHDTTNKRLASLYSNKVIGKMLRKSGKSSATTGDVVTPSNNIEPNKTMDENVSEQKPDNDDLTNQTTPQTNVKKASNNVSKSNILKKPVNLLAGAKNALFYNINKSGSVAYQSVDGVGVGCLNETAESCEQNTNNNNSSSTSVIEDRAIISECENPEFIIYHTTKLNESSCTETNTLPIVNNSNMDVLFGQDVRSSVRRGKLDHFWKFGSTAPIFQNNNSKRTDPCNKSRRKYFQNFAYSQIPTHCHTDKDDMTLTSTCINTLVDGKYTHTCTNQGTKEHVLVNHPSTCTHHINSYRKSGRYEDMEQLFTEPNNYHSYDLVWNSSKTMFGFMSLMLYRCLTVLLAVPCAFIWALIMSVSCVINVWICGPIITFLGVWLELVQRLWTACCKTILTPVVEAWMVGKYTAANSPNPNCQQCCKHHVITFEGKNGDILNEQPMSKLGDDKA